MRLKKNPKFKNMLGKMHRLEILREYVCCLIVK